MKQVIFNITPVSRQVPFDNSTNGFVSSNAQEAIEEAVSLGGEASRGGFVCSFDGNATVGRWLEFSANNPSNTVPLIIAEPGRIRAISLASAANSTCTVSLFKNGLSIETLTLSNSRKNNKKNLNHGVTDLDEISVQVTSGSVSRPSFYLFIQTY